jgi:uncharacterized membrane protein YkoI
MSKKSTPLLLASLGLIALLIAPPLALSDDHGDARRLREAGEIVPLKRILSGIKHEQGGRILDAELKRRGDRYQYDVEVLNDRGEVWELRYDARSGRLLQRERGH